MEKIGLWGFGNMNKIIIKYLLEKDYEVVVVIGRHDIGKDAGTIAGIEPLGVHISDPKDASNAIQAAKPALMIMATNDSLTN